MCSDLHRQREHGPQTDGCGKSTLDPQDSVVRENGLLSYPGQKPSGTFSKKETSENKNEPKGFEDDLHKHVGARYTLWHLQCPNSFKIPANLSLSLFCGDYNYLTFYLTEETR